jgi:hypothetical protein
VTSYITISCSSRLCMIKFVMCCPTGYLLVVFQGEDRPVVFVLQNNRRVFLTCICGDKDENKKTVTSLQYIIKICLMDDSELGSRRHTKKVEAPSSATYFVRTCSQRSYNYIYEIISVGLKFVRTITVTFNSPGSIFYLNKICRNVILYRHYTDKFATPFLLQPRNSITK